MTYPLLAVTNQKSVTSSLHLPSRHWQSSMLGQRQPNKQYEFVDVGGGHKARLLLRRTTIGAQCCGARTQSRTNMTFDL